jgi:hypothetical protein
MSKIIKRKLKFGPDMKGEYFHSEVTFRSVVPTLEIKDPKNLSYDFSATLAEILGVPEKNWRIPGLGISKYVPARILYEFYDASLMYLAMQKNSLDDAFGALAAERIILKSVSGMPEIMVKYRYYLGIADNKGEYKIVSGKGDDLQLIGIQDPYDRLFWLDTPATKKKIIDMYGKTSIIVEGNKKIEVYNNKCNSKRQLGFNKCLSTIIPEKTNPVREFLQSIYTNVRIPEYHVCRLGDNALFELDKLMSNLVKAMNYLFTNNLNLPYKRRKRKPFAIRLFRMASAQPYKKNKMKVENIDILLPAESAKKYY